MNRVNVENFGGGENLRYVQVALRGRRRANAPGLVREAHVQGVAVGYRMHRYVFDPEFTTGPDDPAGDFTTVGDQNFFEHTTVGSGDCGLRIADCGLVQYRARQQAAGRVTRRLLTRAVLYQSAIRTKL